MVTASLPVLKDVMIETVFLMTDAHQPVKFKFSGLVTVNHQFVNTTAQLSAVTVELKMDKVVMMETQ